MGPPTDQTTLCLQLRDSQEGYLNQGSLFFVLVSVTRTRMRSSHPGKNSRLTTKIGVLSRSLLSTYPTLSGLRVSLQSESTLLQYVTITYLTASMKHNFVYRTDPLLSDICTDRYKICPPLSPFTLTSWLLAPTRFASQPFVHPSWTKPFFVKGSVFRHALPRTCVCIALHCMTWQSRRAAHKDLCITQSVGALLINSLAVLARAYDSLLACSAPK